MNRASCFIIGVAFGIAALYITMHFTLVRASDGFHAVPKIAAKVEVPYADIRKLTLQGWQRKPALALSILKANKGYLLGSPALLEFKQANLKILERFSAPDGQAFGG
jgi:hypothetical protein